LQHIIDVQKNYRSDFEMLLRGKIPQRKKGFSAFCIFNIGGDEDFLNPEQIIGLVVFTGDAEFKTDPPPGVFSLDNVVQYLKGRDDEVLTENRMQFCVGRIECHRLALTQKTDVEHQENLSRR
jgi:hypothetical protein